MAPAFKRRKISTLRAADRPEALTFDPSARQEYLTGFHKRKQARIQHARETAVKREKEEKVIQRRQLREQRKEDLEQHVSAVNAELKKQMRILDGKDGEESEEESAGGEADEDEPSGGAGRPEDVMRDEEEYVDEDKYTTVTVEAMGEDDEEEEENEEDAFSRGGKAEANGAGHEAAADAKPIRKKRPWAKDGADKAKVKKKKFRYESKAERSTARAKQKSKNSRQAQARRKGN